MQQDLLTAILDCDNPKYCLCLAHLAKAIVESLNRSNNLDSLSLALVIKLLLKLSRHISQLDPNSEHSDAEDVSTKLFSQCSTNASDTWKLEQEIPEYTKLQVSKNDGVGPISRYRFSSIISYDSPAVILIISRETENSAEVAATQHYFLPDIL